MTAATEFWSPQAARPWCFAAELGSLPLSLEWRGFEAKMRWNEGGEGRERTSSISTGKFLPHLMANNLKSLAGELERELSHREGALETSLLIAEFRDATTELLARLTPWENAYEAARQKGSGGRDGIGIIIAVVGEMLALEELWKSFLRGEGPQAAEA